MRKITAIICEKCKKLITDQPKPGIFRCIPCNNIIALVESEGKNLLYKGYLTYPLEDFNPN